MNNVKYLLIFFMLNFYTSLIIKAQQGFKCDGNNYLTFNQQLFNIQISSEGNYTLLPVYNFGTTFVDAIAFNHKDGYIYGIFDNREKIILWRLAGNSSIELLDTLNLSFDYLYHGAAITPDGKRLVLITYAVNPNQSIGNQLVFIDLFSPDFALSILPIKRNSSNVHLFCADIAFSPYSNTLYSFDSKQRKLVSIDVNNGLVTDVGASIDIDVNGINRSIAALLFDTFDNLYGFLFKNEIGELYLFNKTNGSAIKTYQQEEGKNNFTDACSCPYTIALRQVVAPQQVYPCTEVTYTIHVSNLTQITQGGLTFRDSLPTGFAVRRVLRNPFGGTINGIGTNKLQIENITLPHGIDSIQLLVYIPEDAEGSYAAQASVAGVDLTQGNDFREVVYSDYPITVEPDDPTPLTVLPLKIAALRDTFELCRDSSVTLSPVANTSGLQFRWATGSRDSTLTVKKPGDYAVTITSGCKSAETVLKVIPSPISVDLGKDQEIKYGNSLEMIPFINTIYPINNYQWQLFGSGTLSCNNCAVSTLLANENIRVHIEVKNEAGCRASDELEVKVVSHVFAPNAFSPNNDGVNDRFFLQTEEDVQINVLQVFDRWGNLLFERRNFYTNQELEGWDSKIKGKTASPGVYIWQAVLEYEGSVRTTIRGEITLMR